MPTTCSTSFLLRRSRPRRIEGRDAFLAVMQPLWQQARQLHIKVVGCREQIHETVDPDFIVAEFVFDVETAGGTVEVPFVQFFKVRDGRIAAVQEYFSPPARSEALGQG